MEDAVLGICSAIELGKIVPGAGAVEIELAKKLREFGNSIGGREQLAINAFADAIEVVPRTLAESTGMDPIDILVNARSKHNEGAVYGINVFTGKVIDAEKEGIIEPLKIKTQAIKSACEAAEMILRIDDVITSKAPSTPQMPQGHGMGEPGMGEEY